MALQFACQWLHVKDFDTSVEKNERLYPDFDQLKEAMLAEVMHFFTDLIRHDRGILSILDADHTYLNQELAEFYGMPWPQGVDGPA